MQITDSDFPQDFLAKFGKDEGQMLVSFANSFINVNVGIISKEELIKRLSKLKSIIPLTKPIGSTMGGQYSSEIEYVKFPDDPLLSKSFLYHELEHLVSTHYEYNDFYPIVEGENRPVRRCRGLNRGNGLAPANQPEINEGDLLEEIMTENNATRYLEYEGIYIGGHYCYTSINNAKNQNSDFVPYTGTGYSNLSFLGRLYEKYVFGWGLKYAKYVNGENFRKVFNECYKDVAFDGKFESHLPPYTRFCNQRDPYNRALSFIRMVAADETKKCHLGKFDLYDYLDITSEMVLQMPQKHSDIKGQISGLETCLSDRLRSELEESDICIIKLLRPDLFEDGVNDLSNEVRDILRVITLIRYNMKSLNRENVMDVSYTRTLQPEDGNYLLFINIDNKKFVSSNTKIAVFSPLSEQTLANKTGNYNYASLSIPQSTIFLEKDGIFYDENAVIIGTKETYKIGAVFSKIEEIK